MHYLYKCKTCKQNYLPEEFEKDFQYLCPNCGTTEKNKPLTGTLLIDYDYNHLKKLFSREEFLKQPVGEFWLYPYLWPLHSVSISDKIKNRLKLSGNPILDYSFQDFPFQVFDDTRNSSI